MKYLPESCRQKDTFKKCCKQQIDTFFNYVKDDFFIDDDFAVTKLKDLEKYKNSKILIVGGGPTTNWFNWDASNYDYIFSCNKFYLHDKLKRCVDFAMLSSEIDINSEIFINYYNNSKTIFCYENVDVKQEYIETMLNRGRTIIAILRKNLKNGSAARLLYLTSFFQPKEIHIVGMDGLPKDIGKTGVDCQHSFEKGKLMNSIHFNYDRYYNEYKMLWSFLKDKFPNIFYKNLGHGHPYNISTHFNIG